MRGENGVGKRSFGTIAQVSDTTVHNARLIAVFDAALAAVAALLVWRSLTWPLIGDATIFHFIAGQMQMGAVPYRDIVDINMPLIYDIHAAIVAVGGMSDGAWRAFDLMAAAIMSPEFWRCSGRPDARRAFSRYWSCW